MVQFRKIFKKKKKAMLEYSLVGSSNTVNFESAKLYIFSHLHTKENMNNVCLRSTVSTI